MGFVPPDHVIVWGGEFEVPLANKPMITPVR